MTFEFTFSITKTRHETMKELARRNFAERSSRKQAVYLRGKLKIASQREGELYSRSKFRDSSCRAHQGPITRFSSRTDIPEKYSRHPGNGPESKGE